MTDQEKLKHVIPGSWYLDANGKNTVNWPGFTFPYRLATRRVDTADYQFIDPPRGA